ncbi:uncharacterized protein TNCT_147391 [Trichonephila clavata]|uniref:DNA-directed DNA polymerase n=1 Tax=Trichonephila clavata TaxID=2740835 RepID=A0A8X6HW77_TRICU|nr:uncharacterized protein TNCT_147391 [Trichonephila clavata]
MVPVQGYCNSTNFSRDSIRWLDFVAPTEGHRILHALNGTGEPKIAGYSVDGFCKETNTVYQYQGCFHHGCEICYDGDLIHPLAGTTMRSLRQKKEGVIDTLRQTGYNIIQMLEHDFVNLKKTEEFKEFLLQHEVTERLNPRDAFFGGIKLFFEGCAKYIDFTSLYPWVNKYCEYPVGHPEIITEDFQDIDSYFSLVKCKVFPPKNLFHPVLPFRCNDKNSINVHLGQRSVAKLALNSFWGRWGMNLNKSKLTFVSTVLDFSKMLIDKKHIKDVFLPTPEIAAFQWTQNNYFVTQDSSTNIFIAAFTTCHARLTPYSEIEKLNEGIYTDELNGGTITSFVTGGPKNYAYKLSDGSEICKIRGFTLNFQNSLVLNYDSVKELVSKKTVALSGGKKKTIKRKNCFVL